MRAALLICCVFLSGARGEEPGASPESPNWTAAPDPSAVSSPAAAEAEFGEAAPSLPPGEPPPDATDNTAPLALEATASTDPAAPESTLGVPESGHNFLPDFADYGRGLFERQGLRFRAGPVHLRFELSASVEHSDNIFGTATDPVSDLIARIAPLLRIGLGDFQGRAEDYVAIEYQPDYEEFFQNPGQSHLNQNLQASGKATFSRYTTDFRLGYVQNNQPNATQTGRQGYQNLEFAWNNSYYLGAKTYVSATLSASNQNYDTGQNYTTYSISPQLGYAYSPKTTIFAGPYAGIAYVGEGATQSFQGATIGITYDTLRKLTFQGSVGLQARQFQGFAEDGDSDFVTPIFNLAAIWKPSDYTSVQFTFDRSVGISDLGQGLTYTLSAIGLLWEQRFLNTFSFTLSTQYQFLDYQTNPFIYPDGRKDQYVVVRPMISYRFWHDQAAISVYYQRQQRTSDVEFNSYTINIYGIQLLYRF